jgi:hypothetical protein
VRLVDRHFDPAQPTRTVIESDALKDVTSLNISRGIR